MKLKYMILFITILFMVAGFTACSDPNGGTRSKAGTPASPENVQVTVMDDTSIKVQWNSVALAASYKVYYSKTNSFSLGNPSVAVLPSGNLSDEHTVVSLDPFTNYYIWVAAINSKGEGSPSGMKSATTKMAKPVLTVTGNGAGKLKVTWLPVNGAASYYLYYDQTGGSDTTAKESGLTVTEWEITGLQSGVDCYVRVYAWDSGMNNWNASIPSSFPVP